MVAPEVSKLISEHPCYDDSAHRKFARMHLPVAPRCNIQCNYCNRKYDCSNESRPGVTSEVLTPSEAADKVGMVLERIPELKVIGIAGPGDPLANESTYETIALVSERYPDLTLCISTNGLALPGNAKRLYDLGVRFLTITMNAIDPKVGSVVYGRVFLDGKELKGEEAASALIERQLKGLEECVSLGMVVKINIVMIPVTLGIGIDGAIYLLQRYQTLGRGSVLEAVRQVGGPVFMSSATTVVGFGGMTMSQHMGLNTMGQLAIIGISICFCSTFLIEPGLILISEKLGIKALTDHDYQPLSSEKA